MCFAWSNDGDSFCFKPSGERAFDCEYPILGSFRDGDALLYNRAHLPASPFELSVT